MGPNELIERTQWDFFWVPEDAEVLERPELGAVRCPRPFPYLNCVTRTRCAPAALPSLVAEGRAYHRYGISRWLVPDTYGTEPLERELSRAGYAPVQHHEARVVRPETFRPRPGGGFEVRPVRSLAALRDCVGVARRAFGLNETHSEAELRQGLAQCTDPGGRIRRFVVYRGGEPVSSGGFNWYPDLRFVYLWAGGTVPEARGAGAYSALVSARIEGARAFGAEWVGLYAKSDTSAPIVARQGFERVGEMSYWGRTLEPA